MRRAFLTTIAFFLSLSAHAELCIRLEGLSIGCVPSVDHPCFRNKNIAVDGADAGHCKYLPEDAFLPPGDPKAEAYFDKTIAAQAGPIAWRCQTWEQGSTCPPGGDVTTCPMSKCKVYYNPVCRNQCTWCVKDVKQSQARAAGCIVCTRPRCEDEPSANPACDVHPVDTNGQDILNYWLPDRIFPLCPATANADACPTSLTPPTADATCSGEMLPNGACVVTVEGGAGDCGPRPPIKKADAPPPPRHCPWIADERTYVAAQDGPPPVPEQNRCEAIRPGNRFPQDCCKCRKNPGAPVGVDSNGQSVMCNDGCGPLPARSLCPDGPY